MRKVFACALLGLAACALAACGGDSASGTEAQAVDTDIAIVTTDLESLPMGSGQACIARLTKIVDVDYVRAHEVAVEDESAANAAIASAIVAVCAEGPPDQISHQAAHEVVHAVEDALE
jgi:ABC-type glycerol-3-phosphate transport system substrate-binding protein